MLGLTHFVRGCVSGVILLLAMPLRFLSTPHAVAGVFCTAAVSTLAAEAREPKQSYNLPRGDAATTLGQFGKVSGRQIIFMMEKVRGEQTNAVAGDFTPREALERMLAGTALVATVDAATGSLVISRRRPAASAPPEKERVDPPSSDRKNAKASTFVARIAAWLAVAVAPASADAQAPDARAAALPPAEDVVQLDAFRVTETDSRGYRAENTTSGTLVRTAIRDLPVSIQVVTEQFLADMDVRRVEDAIRYISGVGLTSRNEGARGATRSENFVIRGFETSQVLRNGLRLQGITNSANLERVEVLKGPTSIFFGASDPGGLVNYITKQPREGRFGSVKASVGRFDYRYAELDYNAPLVGEKTVLFRVTGSLLDSEGWRKFWKDEQQFINPVVVWNVTPTTRLTYDYQYRRQTGLQERMGDVFLSTDNPAPHTQRLLTGDALRRSIELNALTPTDTYWEKADSHVATLVQTLGRSTVLQLVAGSSDANRLQRTTVTRNRVTLANDFTYTDRPGLVVQGGVNRTINLNLLHDLSFAHMRHKIVAGWDRSEVRNKNVYIAYTPNSPNSITRRLFDPLPEAELYRVVRYPTLAEIGQPDVGFISNVPWEKPGWDQGVYLTDQVTLLHDRMNVMLGARWSTLRDQQREATTPQAGVNFALTPAWTVYALYSESFRGNGRSDSRDPNSSFLPPEEGVGFEVGSKVSLLDRKLTGTVALFEVTKKNIRRVDSGAVVEGRNGVVLSDGERSRGVELDLLYTPNRNLTAVFAYAYTDAKVTKDVINPGASPDLDGNGIADTIGLRLKGVSPSTVSLWLKYEFTEGPLRGFVAGTGYQWRDGPIPLDASFQRKFVTQGAYDRLDLLLSYSTRVFGKLTKFQVNLDNVTDEFYADKALGYADPFRWRFTVGMDF